jgi:uncharacterized protein YbjQ (UPF0145 family)
VTDQGVKSQHSDEPFANPVSPSQIQYTLTLFPAHRMIVVTVGELEGKPVKQYLGIVSGEAILGANIFKDFFAGIRDIVGGRAAAYEEELRKAKQIAIEEMTQQARELGANAILGVDLDYESITSGQTGGMLMVSANGTAVRV